MPPKITKNPKNQRGKKRKKIHLLLSLITIPLVQKLRLARGSLMMLQILRRTTSDCPCAVHGEYVQTSETAISDLVDKGYIFVLPERDQHGRRVIFSQAAAFDSSKDTVSDLMRTHVMTFEALLNDEENQVRGFTYIFDEKDVS